MESMKRIAYSTFFTHQCCMIKKSAWEHKHQVVHTYPRLCDVEARAVGNNVQVSSQSCYEGMTSDYRYVMMTYPKIWVPGVL